jgi:hypothetical protein
MNRNKLCIVDDGWGWANAASQHRAGREPSHLTVSRPYGRPSHFAVTNTRLISTHVRRPPVPRGHRTYIGKQEWK